MRTACLAVLVALPLLIEARALVPGRVLSPAGLLFWYPPWQSMRQGPVRVDPLQSDMAFVFQPWLVHARREIREGRLPLWNPHADLGVPFLANMQSGVFSPFNAIAYALPLSLAIALGAIAKLEVAGLGTWAFLRLLGTGPVAALLGGTAFMLSGFVVAWLGWSLGSVGVWLPVVLAAVERTRQRPDGLSIAALAASVALQWFGGHPETSAHVLSAAGLWTLWRARDGNGPAFLGRAAAGMALGTLAAAVVILPFLDYLPRTAAWAARRAAEGMPVWPLQLSVSLLVPRYLGHPGTGTLWNENFTSNYTELSGAVGLVPWLLLPCLFLRGGAGRRHAPFFAVLGLLCVPFMYLVPGITPLLASLPGIGMMSYTRLVLVAGFCLSVLGALGLDALLAAEPAERRRFVFPASAWLVGLLALIGWRFSADRGAIIAGHAMWYVRAEVAQAAVLLFVGGLLVRRVLFLPLPGSWPVAALFAVQFASVIPFAWSHYPVIPSSEFFPRTPAIDFLTAAEPGGRVALQVPNVAGVYGLSDPSGCDAMNPLRSARLVAGKADFGRYGNDPVILPAKPSRRLLDLLGVRHLLDWPRKAADTPGLILAYEGRDARVWRNPTALPPAFLVPVTRTASGDEALALLEKGTVDPRRVALVEGTAPMTGTNGTVTVESHEPGRLAVRTASRGPSFLVFLESWDPGWTARVDGVRTPVIRTNYAFCGVTVPADAARVVFAYRPLAFTLGLIVSLLAAAGIAILAVRRAPPRKP